MADDTAATVPVVPAPAQAEKKAKAPLHFEDEAGLFKTVCRTFMHKKKCTRASCKFVHDKQLCPHFWKTGRCKFGDECRKNHFLTLPDPNAKGEDNITAAAAPSGGEEFEKKKPANKPKSNKLSDNKAKADKTKEEAAPRDADKQDAEKKAKKKKKNERRQATKKNTESFVPMTKPVDLRITYDLGSKNDKFSTPLTSRDVATRFNWYKDTSQWKPFHFDAAAVKPHIAAIQNFTVGISFGATRDAAFEHAETKTVVSVPQPDGCVYAFSKDTNVIWRHGILRDVPVREEGRISVIAWGWVDNMADVASPVAAVS
ncbi:hypothetical protein JG687_00004846 [Phytophthora cactorum]|uniref:C3H1-type domain-containing protein n=1 Tax=Phytophthora cactorum TaxID=29920 RepID=A0A8T1UQE5_9STRA|nr:hypothetical protein JG687_00004846 [Phytophthora cactorum]